MLSGHLEFWKRTVVSLSAVSSKQFNCEQFTVTWKEHGRTPVVL